MNKDEPCILVINGGSSSIKFALFENNESMTLLMHGVIEGIGLNESRFTVKWTNEATSSSWTVKVHEYSLAVEVLMHWLRTETEPCSLKAVGHRLVHGGTKYWNPQRITSEMLAELHEFSLFDPEHLPEELLLTEEFHRQFPDLIQIACFDTAFHHEMPRLAKMLPIPRRYEAKGVHRYGFHGLSYSYLMEELAEQSATQANGRIILAHFGSGASLAAVLHGRSIDTTMGFTPAAGLLMGTRSGDIDPGLVAYMAKSEKMTADEFNHLINHESGLFGISETSSDMKELLAKESTDIRAKEAVALFCYQAKKWIGAYTALLGGLDTLVFSGGIGENAPPVRERICDGLSFLGIDIDSSLNETNAEVISSNSSQVTVRVIHTDEELMIARSVRRLLNQNHAEGQ